MRKNITFDTNIEIYKILLPEEALKKYWGFDHFRPLQKEIIQSIINGKDTFALLPTGGGKSICFQIPALCMEGIAIVVSPLIALINDQVLQLKNRGIAALQIQSGMTKNDIEDTLEKAMRGNYKMIYVSPERLQTQVFQEFLPYLKISFIAVDEAHCISQWGYDFRPPYLEIAKLKEVYPALKTIALTGSANNEVINDIISKLEFSKDYNIFKKSFVRENLHFKVVETDTKAEDISQRYALKKSAIVYAGTRGNCEKACFFFNNVGIASMFYHAGLSKLEREITQDRWLKENPPLVVSTNAFGMGIDKPNVRQVFHLDMAKSPEAYYQEAGRAGRDGAESVVYLMYNQKDISKLRDYVLNKFPTKEEVYELYSKLNNFLDIGVGEGFDQTYYFDILQFSSTFKLNIYKVLHFLKLFEQDNFWVLYENVSDKRTIVQLYAKSEEFESLDLKNLQHAKRVLVSLMRLYSNIRFQKTKIVEMHIAKESELHIDHVSDALKVLQKLGFITLEYVSSDSLLYFQHGRIPIKELVFDWAKMEFLKKREVDRIKQMVNYAENKTICRHKLLVSFFGEEMEMDCEKCDICKNKSSNKITKEKLMNFVNSKNEITLNELKEAFFKDNKTDFLSWLRMGVNLGWWAIGDDGKMYKIMKAK